MDPGGRGGPPLKLWSCCDLFGDFAGTFIVTPYAAKGGVSASVHTSNPTQTKKVRGKKSPPLSPRFFGPGPGLGVGLHPEKKIMLLRLILAICQHFVWPISKNSRSTANCGETRVNFRDFFARVFAPRPGSRPSGYVEGCVDYVQNFFFPRCRLF